MKWLGILETQIIIFEDGKYFNGVKGKCVRKTEHIKDAKNIGLGEISDRDKNYLNGHNYRLVKVKYTLEEIE